MCHLWALRSSEAGRSMEQGSAMELSGRPPSDQVTACGTCSCWSIPYHKSMPWPSSPLCLCRLLLGAGMPSSCSLAYWNYIPSSSLVQNPPLPLTCLWLSSFLGCLPVLMTHSSRVTVPFCSLLPTLQYFCLLLSKMSLKRKTLSIWMHWGCFGGKGTMKISGVNKKTVIM